LISCNSEKRELAKKPVRSDDSIAVQTDQKIILFFGNSLQQQVIGLNQEDAFCCLTQQKELQVLRLI